jgi:hypothetical protein
MGPRVTLDELLDIQEEHLNRLALALGKTSAELILEGFDDEETAVAVAAGPPVQRVRRYPVSLGACL